MSTKKRDNTWNLVYFLQRLWIHSSNRFRLRTKQLDYVYFMLSDEMPLLPESRNLIQRRLFGEPPLSLWELDRRFERIAQDTRTKGVVLHLRELGLGLADLQSLRDSLQRLRKSGKRVVCYAQEYDLARYYVACGADEILMQPSGFVLTVGLRQEVLYFKDALEQLGIAIESVAISPYKGANDALTRSEPSAEASEQLNWLLDSQYAQLLNGIVEGRNLTESAARDLIDRAPYTAKQALEAQVVDALVTEEQLYQHLQSDSLFTWEDAESLLLTRPRRPQDEYLAILKVEGLIFPGESDVLPGSSPIPVPVVDTSRTGDVTFVRHVRALMEDEDLAGVLLVVDSGGGAATAAESMRSALAELNRKVPIVVFMNNVAASGGYLVSMPARHIVAQHGTITGSIGVISSKPSVGGLRDKLHLKGFEYARGENADILSLTKPFSESQRAWMLKNVQESYEDFVAQVAHGRNMTPDAVDAVGGGRVWTGEQALAHGLVDSLGDLRHALDTLRQLAQVESSIPIALVEGKTKPLVPQVAERANPVSTLAFMRQNAHSLLNGQPQWIMPFRVNHK